MPQRLVNEREHRRGLVLGLTLAEMLLLLVFVLLLALGARLNQFERDKLAAQSERDQYKAEAESIVTGSVDTSERQEILSDIDIILGSDPKKLGDLKTMVKAAAKINPNDPPAELKRMLE